MELQEIYPHVGFACCMRYFPFFISWHGPTWALWALSLHHSPRFGRNLTSSLIAIEQGQTVAKDLHNIAVVLPSSFWSNMYGDKIYHLGFLLLFFYFCNWWWTVGFSCWHYLTIGFNTYSILTIGFPLDSHVRSWWSNQSWLTNLDVTLID